MSRKILFQLHWLLGITAGLILSIMGLTGATVSYQDQILQTLNPDSFYVQPQTTARLTPVDLYQRANALFPDSKISSITMSGKANESDIVSVTSTQNKQNQTYYFNPYSGASLPQATGQSFFDLMLNLHRQLTLGEVGSQLTGASTLALLFFLISGLYLRWPSRKKRFNIKEWLQVRWHLKGRSFLWYFHAVVGTWVLVFYLLLALTGLFWSYDWYKKSAYWIMGVEPPKMQMMGKSGDHRPKENGKAIDMPAVLTQSWQVFQQQVPSYAKATYRLQNMRGKTVDITYMDINPAHDRARNTFKYDIEHQQVVSNVRYSDKKLNEKILASIRAIHTGSFIGSVWQLMTTIAALCMPVFFITGWMMYLKRRQQNKLKLAKRAQLDS